MFTLRNPVLLLAFGLPLCGVIASFVSLGFVLAHPESEMPAQYHWEGAQLDRDFARGARAAELHVTARVVGLGTAAVCRLQLRMTAAPPDTLALSLTHAIQPGLDQYLVFRRVAAYKDIDEYRATYASGCAASPSGHWRIDLVDAKNGWSLRQSLRGSPADVALDSGSPHSD
jgi:hypothetical protein